VTQLHLSAINSLDSRLRKTWENAPCSKHMMFACLANQVLYGGSAAK
jgi:hypothetical protein